MAKTYKDWLSQWGVTDVTKTDDMSDYDYREGIYLRDREQQMSALDEAYGSAVKTANDNYDTQKAYLDQQLGRSMNALQQNKDTQMQNADVLHQKMSKYLKTQADASGLAGTGYASDGSLAMRANAQYSNNLGNIEQDYTKNVNDLNMNYGNNMYQVNSERNNALAKAEQSKISGQSSIDSNYNKNMLDLYNQSVADREQATLQQNAQMDAEYKNALALLQGGYFGSTDDAIAYINSSNISDSQKQALMQIANSIDGSKSEQSRAESMKMIDSLIGNATSYDGAMKVLNDNSQDLTESDINNYKSLIESYFGEQNRLDKILNGEETTPGGNLIVRLATDSTVGEKGFLKALSNTYNVKDAYDKTLKDGDSITYNGTVYEYFNGDWYVTKKAPTITDYDASALNGIDVNSLIRNPAVKRGAVPSVQLNPTLQQYVSSNDASGAKKEADDFVNNKDERDEEQLKKLLDYLSKNK